jgi:hypothetical protein
VFSYYNTRNFLYLIKKSFKFPSREIILIKVIYSKVKHQKLKVLKILLNYLNLPVKIEAADSPILFGLRDFLKEKMGKTEYRF